jgi:hypothetical protein
MPFGEHQTGLLIFFFKLWLFSGHCSVKPSTVDHHDIGLLVRLMTPINTFLPSSSLSLLYRETFGKPFINIESLKTSKGWGPEPYFGNPTS